MTSLSTHVAPRAGLRGKRPASFWYWPIRALSRAPVYLSLLAGTVIFAGPLYWLIISSLKPESEVYSFPPTFFPGVIRWDNYPYALSLFPFVRSLVNTLILIGLGTTGRLLSASLAAFAFARMRFPGRDVLFALVLSTMMIPYYVTLIPQYLIFRDLGWIDTLLPLWVPEWLGGGAFFIFLLRQFFRTIPKEYDDAARIDGCGTFGIFWRIILPLSKPALGTVAIFTFMFTWNDFFGPLIYLNSPENHTLALAYMNWQQMTGVIGVNKFVSHIMAIGTLITIPPVMIFFFLQRYFIQGVVISGVKG